DPIARRRKSWRIPGGVGHPEKRRAVDVFKMMVVLCDADGTVLRKTALACGRGAEKFAGLIVQPAVQSVRARRAIGPVAGHVRREAHPPGFAAIPKGVD